MGAVGRLFVDLQLRLDNYRRQLQQAQSQSAAAARGIEGVWRDANGRLRDQMGRFVAEANSGVLGLNMSFKELIATLTQGYIALKAFQTLQFGVQFNAQLESTLMSFETLLKSAEEAKLMVKDLQEFAATTPFEFVGVQKSAKTLLAMGIAADQIMPSMNAIGNAVAAVGGTDEQLQRISLAIGQISTKGRISAEEMNQLAENGIPAWGILSEKMNLSTQELMKLGEQGKLLSAEALPLLLDGLNERYAGGIQKQAQTFTGLLSTFMDSLKIFTGEATKPLFEGLKDSLEDIMRVMKEMQSSGELKALAEDIGAALKAVFDGAVIAAKGIIAVGSAIRENWKGLTVLITGVAAGFAAFKVVGLVAAAFKAYRTGVMAATVAQWAFNAAQYANPIMWIPIAIAAVVAAVVGLVVAWKTNFGNIQERTKAVMEMCKGYFTVFYNAVALVINSIKLGFLKMGEFVVWVINGIVQAVPFFSDGVKQSMNSALDDIRAKGEETKADIVNNFEQMKSGAEATAAAGYDVVRSYEAINDVWANAPVPWYANSNSPEMKKLISESKERVAAAKREEKAKADAAKRVKEEETRKAQDAQKKIAEGRKKDFEQSRNWIEDRKEFWGMTLKEELAAWDRVQKRFAKGTEERKEADREMMRVQIEIAKEVSQKKYEEIQNSVESEKKATLDLIESKKSTYEKDFDNQSKILEKKSKAVIKGYQDEKKALQDSRETKKFDKEQTDLNEELVTLERDYNKYKNAVSLQGQQKAADILEKMNATKQKIQENADERAFNQQLDAIDKNIETEQNRYDAEKEEREKQRAETLDFYTKQKEDAQQKYTDIEKANETHYKNLTSQITAYNTGSITALKSGQEEILKMLEGKATGYFDTGKKLGESFKSGIDTVLNQAQTAADEKIKSINSMVNPIVNSLSNGNQAILSTNATKSSTGVGQANIGSVVTVQNLNVNNGVDSRIVAYDIANTTSTRLRSAGVRA